MRDENISCSLDVLYGGLGISKLQFLITKYNFFSAVNFKFFLIETLDLDLDPHCQKMLDPDTH